MGNQPPQTTSRGFLDVEMGHLRFGWSNIMLTCLRRGVCRAQKGGGDNRQMRYMYEHPEPIHAWAR